MHETAHPSGGGRLLASVRLWERGSQASWGHARPTKGEVADVIERLRGLTDRMESGEWPPVVDEAVES